MSVKEKRPLSRNASSSRVLPKKPGVKRAAIAPKPSAFDAIRRLVQRIDSMPPATWEHTPTDLATNVEHYLYGAPRERDDSV